jgi:MinD superfamily P-loop ATPase
VDLNNYSEANKYCDQILYLVEPSYIMLTKLLRRNKNAFLDHKDDYIVLNKSFVNDQEIADFEFETKSKIFANIPPLNDRNNDLHEINQFLTQLGYDCVNN